MKHHPVVAARARGPLLSCLGLATAGWLAAADPVPAFLQAESDIADGRSFEAAATYRQALAGATGADEALAPEVELALHELNWLDDDTGGAALSLPVYEAVARAAAARPGPAWRETAALATYMQGFARLETGAGLDEAERIWEPLGFLRRYRIIGPFDNERGSQILTPFGPEKELKMDGVYDGKKRPVAWRSLPAPPRAGRIDFAALLAPAEEALAYAAVWVRSPEDREAALRVSTDEAVRVWWNGALVHSREIERRFGFDHDAIAVTLRKGWNVALFKVGQSSGSWELAARLTARDGAPLPGLEQADTPPAEAAPPEPVLPEAGARPDEKSQISRAVDALLAARLAAKAEDARAHYVLGALLLARKAHDAEEHPDTEQLKQAVQLEPDRPLHHLALAWSLDRESTIAAQRDDNAWRHALEKASALGSALADSVLARYYHETFNNHSRALELIERALARNPQLEDALLLRGEVEHELRFPLARERARQTVAGLPHKEVATILELAANDETRGRSAAAEAAYRELAGRSALGAAPERLVELLLLLGRDDEAMALRARTTELEPLATAAHLEAARAFEGRDRLDDAVRSLDRALTIRPEDEGILARKADLLLRLDRKAEALEALDRSLALQPNQPELREHTEYLRAAASRFEDGHRRDVAAAIREALAQKTPPGGNDPARVLLDLTAIEVNPDGTQKQFAQTVVQVLNDRGVRGYQRYGAYYSPGDQFLEFRRARVHRPDGTTAEAKLGRFGSNERGGAARVDLPPLSAGDVVEIEYVTEDLQQSFFGDYFGHREVFQETVPVAEKVLVLRVPAARRFHFRQRNMSLEPEVARDETKGTVTYTWTRRDIPRRDPEPAMPDARENGPVLEISTFASWDAFNTWYWNLIKNQFETSPEIARKVRELTSGADDDLSRIRAIYNFVVTDVIYNAWEFGVHGFKPYNASTIFARRFGDCKDKALLMTVMLKEVGIKANPVLIRAEDLRGEDDLTLPMVEHFNHCITFVPGAAGRPDLFLDGTAQFHSYEELPSMDRGATVLVVKEAAASPQDLVHQIPWNDPESLSIVEEIHATIAPDLAAELDVKLAARGDYGVYLRRSFDIEAERKTQLERLYGRRFAGAVVKREQFSNLRNLNEPVSMSVAVEVPRFVVEAPEGLVVRAPEDFYSTGESLRTLGSLETRTTDVLLGTPRRSSLRVVYHLPTGFKVKSLPPAHDLKSRFGRLVVHYREEPGSTPARLIAERLIEITSHRVTVADYTEFRDFAAAVDRLADEKILLAKE